MIATLVYYLWFVAFIYTVCLMIGGSPLFAWYDCWIGVFIDTKKRRVYLFLIPCIGVVIGQGE